MAINRQLDKYIDNQTTNNKQTNKRRDKNDFESLQCNRTTIIQFEKTSFSAKMKKKLLT